jgi:hypothetical protein
VRIVSLNAATIEFLLDKGLSGQDLLEVARRQEMRNDPTAAERKRRQRARQANGHAVTVTRDIGSPYEDTSTLSTDLPDEASASSPPRQPITAAKDHWNENAAQVGWSVVSMLSAGRQKSLGNRLREHGLDGWKAAIARARASPYLAGPDPPTWFTFNWLIKAENFLKLIEGNYDRRHADNSDPTATALARLHAFPGAVGAVG